MENISDILQKYKRVVVVGISANTARPSHWIAQYLIKNGFDVIGVNPAKPKIPNIPVVASLAEIPDPFEIVNVYRSPSAIPELVESLAPRKPAVLWLQPGAQNPQAEERAQELGMTVISGPCIYQEHSAL